MITAGNLTDYTTAGTIPAVGPCCSVQIHEWYDYKTRAAYTHKSRRADVMTQGASQSADTTEQLKHIEVFTPKAEWQS